jgi:hypothetical protein
MEDGNNHCEGTTRKFIQCRMKQTPFCRFHDPDRKRCKAFTVVGLQCAMCVKEEDTHCWRHRS